MTKIYVQGYFRFSDERAEKKFIDLFGAPELAPHDSQGLLDRVYCSVWVDEEVFCNYFQKIPGTPEKVGVIKSKEVPSLNRNQCKLVIKGFLVYQDAYAECRSEKDRQIMRPVLKDLKIEFDFAVKTLAELDRLTGGENEKE